MTLGEFIKKFSHNNIIRLHHQCKGGHKAVLPHWDDVSMDHQVLDSKGKNRHYINNEVLGLVGICFSDGSTRYPEAINIVIEDLGEEQPIVEEVITDYSQFCESNN